jgi:hypothetical protein
VTIKYSLILLFGVHGDESIYTHYVAKCIKQASESFLLPYNIVNAYIIGPYSKWATTHSQHFDIKLMDPNRLHAKSWDSCCFDLPSLLRAREIFYTILSNGKFTIDTFQDLCNASSVSISAIATRPQTIFQDFIGYIDQPAWQTAAVKRTRLARQIKELIGLNPNTEFLFFDIHAGIGEPNSLSVIHTTNNDKVGDYDCFLVNGLARDIEKTNINYYVLEAGIKGSSVNFENILQSFADRYLTQTVTGGNSLLNQAEFRLWQRSMKANMIGHLTEIFQAIIN